MSISDWINVILCILSFVLAVISVVTVVVTLRQNHKMIQNSTRPYVVAEAQVTNFQSPTFYLVIKNFGNSGAVIKEMECDIDLRLVSYREEHIPFSNLNETFIAPRQAITCCLDSLKFKENKIKGFNIRIKYTDGLMDYSEEYYINYKAFIFSVNVRAATQGKEMMTISYALQDLVEKQF